MPRRGAQGKGASPDPGRTMYADLRFYAELRDFLAPDRRSGHVRHVFREPGSVKDAIESHGVPHTEVELIVVNGRSVGFDHQVSDGDRVSVYPVFESFDVSPIVRVRPHPLREPRFVLDVHLGTLARRLRLLGFDCSYERDASDEALVAISTSEGRILLTRDLGLLKRRVITHGTFVRATEPREQVREIVRRFQLAGRISPFSRCISCNGLLEDVPKVEVAPQLPPMTRQLYDEFRRCRDCHKPYWRGAHHARLEELVAEAGADEPRVVRTAATQETVDGDPRPPRRGGAR